MNAPEPKPSRVVVVPAVSKRETVIAGLAIVVALGLVGFGVMTLGSAQQKASGNTLTGKVVGRSFTPLKEETITFGRGGVKNEDRAGEYVLQVRVESEKRTFDIPVPATTYNAVKDGDSFSFMRPRSEQKKVGP